MNIEQMPVEKDLGSEEKDLEGVTLDASVEESTENKIPHVEELVLDTESGSMITKEAYQQKMKDKLENPFDNAAK